MDFFSLPFTTNFSSIAFGVLAVLLVASVIVWVTLFMKIVSLVRTKLLQARALKLLESTNRVDELWLRFSKMSKNPLQEMFTLSNSEVKSSLRQILNQTMATAGN